MILLSQIPSLGGNLILAHRLEKHLRFLCEEAAYFL